MATEGRWREGKLEKDYILRDEVSSPRAFAVVSNLPYDYRSSSRVHL
jgi:hypothetical protein